MSKTVFGVLLTLIGVFLLLFNFNILPENIRHIIFSWEMLLIAIGGVLLVSEQNKIEGTTLILIGVIFLIPDLFDIDIPFKKIIWPALFIVSGVYILVKKNAITKAKREEDI